MTPRILPGPPYPSQHLTPSGYPKSHCIPQGHPASPSPISQSLISNMAPHIPRCTLHPKCTSHPAGYSKSHRAPYIPHATQGTLPKAQPPLLQAPHIPQFCDPMIPYLILHPSWHLTQYPAFHSSPTFHIPPCSSRGTPRPAQHPKPQSIPSHPALPSYKAPCLLHTPPFHIPPYISHDTLHPVPHFLLQHHPKGQHLHASHVTLKLIFPLLRGGGWGPAAPQERTQPQALPCSSISPRSRCQGLWVGACLAVPLTYL